MVSHCTGNSADRSHLQAQRGSVLFTKEQVAQYVALFYEVNYFSVDACYDLGQPDIAAS